MTINLLDVQRMGRARQITGYAFAAILLDAPDRVPPPKELAGTFAENRRLLISIAIPAWMAMLLA